MMARSPFLLAAGIVSVVLGIASGYAWFGIGRDYVQYLEFYNSLSISDNSANFRFEPGFVLFAHIAKYVMRLDYEVFIAIFVTIALVFKVWVFSYIKNSVPLFLFYLINWYPLHEYTQIRAAMAVSILFVSLRFLLNGKWKSFLILSLLAATFHATALFAAGFLVLSTFLSRYRLPVAVPLALAATIIPPLAVMKLLPILANINPLIESYTMNVDQYEVNIFSGSNILTILLLISMIFSGEIQGRSKKILFIISVSSIGIMIGMQDMPIIAHRLKEILLVFMVFIAVNEKVNIKTFPQIMLAVLLSAWNLQAAIAQGILGG